MNEAFFPASHDQKFVDAFKEFVDNNHITHFVGGQAWVIDRGAYVWRVWFKDPGYERFLKYLESANSPHFPRVLSKVREEPVRFSGMPKGMTASYIKLEKLTPIDKHSGLAAAIDGFAMAEVKHTDLPKTISQLVELSFTFKGDHGEDIDLKAVRSAIMRNQSFFELVIELRRTQFADDIHGENVMMRGQVPVISDPFCFT